MLQHDGQQWGEIGAKRQDGMRAALFTEGEWRAIDQVATMLQDAADKLSLAFYRSDKRSRS